MNAEKRDVSTDYHSDPPHHRSGKLTVIALALLAVGVAVYFALGMPGMDHGNASTMDGMDMSSATPAHRLAHPDSFADALDQPGAVLINVHVPYDGEIEGTDLFMPFNQIDATKLPSDRGSALLVYCRSGTMSAAAAATLTSLGYTNVLELDGGMDAWRASGRAVTMKQAAGQD